MNILFIIPSLGLGGAERVLVNQANRWCKKHAITVLTLNRNKTDFYHLEENIRRESLNIQRNKWYYVVPIFKTIFRMRSYIKKCNPDFVISFLVKANIFTLFATLGTKKKVIVCEHSVIDRPDIDVRQQFLRALFYKTACRVAVLSESIREEFIKLYPGVPAINVVVIPNPLLNEEKSGNERLILKGCFPFDKETDFIILSLGRLVPLKRYDKLIEAFSIFAQENPYSRLVIFGEGRERENLQNLIKKLSLVDKVAMPGTTNSAYDVLSQADLFAMTSLFEGFGLALLEAMKCGIPTVAFDAPGVRDVINNGKNGILVPSGNIEELACAFQKIKDNRDLRLAYSDAGKATAQKFNVESIDKIWFENVLK